MKRRLTRISLLGARSWHEKEFRTAVSLHSHTNHSKEGLDFVPQYASRIPVVSSLLNRERNRYFRLRGETLDLTQGYWTPPVSVKSVFESETERIKGQLGLQPLVSLTDHNHITAANLFQALESSQDMPISLEWSVPTEERLFHLGVHNLPSECSTRIMNELALYTAEPKVSRFFELLAWLNEYPEILVVLNHPLSDLNSSGTEWLKMSVMEFLNRHCKSIHALEINGYRSTNENRATLSLAERYGLPVISGGDRHGCAPNAVLNLTKATTFSEFVSEIRYDKVSEVLLMPEYGRQLVARKLESVADFFRYYPQNPYGQQRWTDRVFFQFHDGVVRPLSYYWHHTVPTWVKSVMWVVSLIRSKYLQLALRMALARKEEGRDHARSGEDVI